MTSSLASQLARISAASTNTLNTRKLKAIHSTSLIFEPSHAATQDLETIYTIAQEGFQELCLLDERFFVFERGLFSESSKDVDRFLLTRGEVKELNASIEAFLQLVSGRLLLKPAMKALEWLVRRFRIQDQNTTALLLAFLPYHNHATLFPTVLSIINAKDLSSELRFLRPYIKPAAPVPRRVVTHTLSHRRETLDLLISHVIAVVKARRESHQLLAFFAAVAVEAISLMCDAARTASVTGVTEETVLQKVLPVLEETYRRQEIPEFQIGGYMLTTVVASKIPMKDEVLLALMGGIVAGWGQGSISPALACLALIAQTRTAGRFPTAVTGRMLMVDDIVQRLLSMGLKYRVDNIVVGLCHGILDGMGKAYGAKELGYAIRLLEESRLGPKGRKVVLSHLVFTAQKLEGFEGLPDEEGEAVRDALATSLLRWSEQGSTKLGKSLQLVFQDSNVDVEMLELALRTVIRRPALTSTADESKVSEAALAETPATLDELLKELPESSDVTSFLAPGNPALLGQLQHIFLLASKSPGDVQNMFNIPLFSGKEETDAFTLSLLARIWTTASNPVIARCAALKQAVKTIKTNSKTKVDYQALIPLALVALADPAEKVRRGAASLVGAIGNTYMQLDQTEDAAVSGKKKKKRKSRGAPDGLSFWGLETTYGSGKETENLKVLDSIDAQKFLDIVITRGTTECIIDPTFVGKLIVDGLGSSKKDKQKDIKQRRLRSSVKTNVLSFLASHAVNVPSPFVQFRLLSMLNQISRAPISRTEFLLPALQNWIERTLEDHIEACGEHRVDIHELEEQLIAVVAGGEGTDGVRTLVKIIGKNLGGAHLISSAARRIIAIYNSLEDTVRVNLAIELLEIRLRESSDGSEDLGSAEAVEILRNVKLPTEAFQMSLDQARAELRAALSLGQASGAKRRKVSSAGGVSTGQEDKTAIAVLRITVVAELLESQEPQSHSSVLRTLFGVLGDLGSVEFSGITYLQSLLLSCARDIFKDYKATNTDLKSTDVVRVDVLVSCIRSSTSPQVQNSALLLLSNLADIAPDTVKHSVMPIFTFMGANTLRQDDEYSAHVIEQTIQRVIPPLVKSLQEQGDGNVVAGGAELVSTFVASYKHVPVHRRLRLFQALTETLGPADFLFAVVAKLAGRYAVGDGEREVKEFVSMLAGGFTAEVQMSSVVKCLTTVKDILIPEPQGMASALFGSEKDGDGINVPPQEMARRLLVVLHGFLASERLKARVAKSLKVSQEDTGKLRGLFSDAMEQTMALGEKYSSHTIVSKEISSVVSQLLELLSIIEFVKVIGGLISPPESPFRSSALTTFKNRVVAEFRTDAASRSAILSLALKAADIVTAQDSEDVLKADALLCIQAVTNKFGKQDPNTISSLADAVVSPGAFRSPDSGLRVLALVCLTSMTTVLGGRIVPVLPKTVPVAIGYLSAAVRSEDSSEELALIHNAVFKYLEELVKTVPNFMASYLSKILPLIAISWDQDDLDEDLPNTVRRSFLSAVAERMELKTVVIAITKEWKSTCTHGVDAIQELVDTVQQAIATAPKAVVQKSRAVLQHFFMSALDLRREQSEELDEDEINPLEDTVLKLCVAMVYKLNDSIFRPMFHRFVEWGTEDLLEGREVRTGVVWKLMVVLNENLKSLVTDYHTPLLPSVVSVLTSERSSSFTAHNVLKALRLGLANDSSDFWQQPAHFDPLLSALLSYLPGGAGLTIPCIVELAAAAQSEEHSKAINSGVLTLMREERAEARLAGTKCLMEIYGRMGEEWLGLLPESVPAIAEILEDDDENVERMGQKLIAKVEEYLGEGELQGMLT